MVTRLYFAVAAASDVNPAFQGSWTDTVDAVRRKLLQAKNAGESLALGTQHAWDTDQLDRQYVSDPMAAGNVFDTAVTYKCQIAAREFAAADNVLGGRSGIFIVSEDGATLRHTVKAKGDHGSNVEFINNASLRNHTVLDGDAGTGSYTTVAGDRLVFEFGYRHTGTTPEAVARYGAPTGTADHGENETETTALVPWFETSLTIAFQGAGVTGTIAQTLPALTQAASGDVAVTGSAASSLPALIQAASGDVLVSATAASVLPALTQAASGKLQIAAVSTQTLAALAQQSVAKVLVSILGAQTLPALIQAAVGDAGAFVAIAEGVGGLSARSGVGGLSSDEGRGGISTLEGS